ncbi:MAG: hypothetical protein ACRC9H_03095, partial [Aeromonas veronii]
YNNTLVYLYQRASSTPSKPSTTSTYNFSTKTLTGFNNGWSTSVPSGTAPLYVTGATASSIGLTDTIEASEWATPVIMAQNGADGLNSASLFLYRRVVATPSVPSANCTYTFSTGVLVGINNGWAQKIPSGTDPLWVTTATAISNTATDTITPSEWATPVIMAQSGVDGKHGAGSYVVTVANQASIPNDAGKDNHILQLSGRAAQSADILTYKDDAKTFSKSYLRGASTWSEFQFVFDGSVIVNGTLAAEALKAETTITDKLYISSTKSKTEMTLSGAGDYRMWSGNADPVLANFSVDKWGNLKANNANIAGHIVANSGSFTGRIDAHDGYFHSAVWCQNGAYIS